MSDYGWLADAPGFKEWIDEHPPARFEPIKVTLRKFADDRWIGSIEGHGDGPTKATPESAAMAVMGDFLQALGRDLQSRKVEAARVALPMFEVVGPGTKEQ